MGGTIAAGLVAMFFFSFAHHLGLVGKIAAVCAEVAACPTCTTFWGVLGVLLLSGCPLFYAAPAALALAYISTWLGLLYDRAARLYSRIYGKKDQRAKARKV